MKTLTCIVDTREQDTPKLRRRMKQIELPIVRESLNVGDYSAKLYLPDGKVFALPASVERKMDITELASCFCDGTSRHKDTGKNRFDLEFDRAKDAGIRLWLLIESNAARDLRQPEYATWENIYAGKYRSHMNPHSLVAKILTFQARYDCRIIFCREETTGRLIRDILHYEAREALERMVDE